MNILILGSGGREHAFAWKLAQSKKLKKLYIAPGNAGTASVGTNVEISVTDFEAIKKFVLENHINMIVVGPEDPLVKGIFDYFEADIQLKKNSCDRPSKGGSAIGRKQGFFKTIHDSP